MGKKCPKVKAFLFSLDLIDWYASEFDVVILRVTLCLVLCSVLVPTNAFGYHSEKAPYQDLFVLQMASPILSEGKVRVSKIATLLGITMVSLSSFNFLALTANLAGCSNEIGNAHQDQSWRVLYFYSH